MSDVNGSFLDKNGLTYLWGKLKALIGAKASVDDIYGLGPNSEIASDADLDTFKTPGIFRRNSSSNSNINSCPSPGTAFKLVVEYENNSNRYRQTVYPILGTGTYYVRVYGASNSWSTWQVFHNKDDTIADIYGTGTDISSTADLNSLTTPGVYQFTSTGGSGLTNSPVTDCAFRLEVRYLNSSARYLQILYPQHTNGPTFFMRIRHSSGWSDWHNDDAYGIGVGLSGTDDLDNIKKPGRYYYGAGAAATIGNAPTRSAGGELTVENIQNTSRIRQTFYVNNAVGDAGYFYTRTYVSTSGGTWSNWYRIDGFGTIGLSIANGTDITTLQTGRYYKDSGVSTVTGLPSDFNYAAFILEVSATLLSYRRTMTLYPAGQDDDGAFYRRLETSAGWGSWKKYVNIDWRVAIPEGADLNDYGTVYGDGIYYSSDSSRTKTLDHRPFSGSAFRLEVVSISSTSKQQRLYPITSSSAASGFYIRSHISSSWGSWYWIPGTSTAAISEYTLLTTEPSDWATAYSTKYYTWNETTRVYKKIPSGSEAPTFETNTYYSKTTA